MKKFYLLLMLTLASLSIKAQNYMDDLDCVKLQGTWVVTNVIGTFKSDFKSTSSIYFGDEDLTYISFENGGITRFKGYWISVSSGNGKYCLHLMPQSIQSTGQYILNLQIEQFRGDTMTLASYDGSARMDLRKENTSSVSSAKKKTMTDGKAYDINGIEISDPNSTKGIVIKDGKKVLQ